MEKLVPTLVIGILLIGVLVMSGCIEEEKNPVMEENKTDVPVEEEAPDEEVTTNETVTEPPVEEVPPDVLDNETVAVPNVIGENLEGAKKTIEDAKLSVGEVSELSVGEVSTESKSKNNQCIMCFGRCVETMINPEHTFTERLLINKSKNELNYQIDIRPGILTGILRDKSINDSAMNTVDSWYRGSIPFMGEMWLVKEIDDEHMILAKGKVLPDVTGMGFTHNFQNYSFKIESIMADPGTQMPMGVSVAVRKPNGSVGYSTATRNKNALVDNMEIWALDGYKAGTIARGDLVVYDVSTAITLEDGGDIDGWAVKFNKITADAEYPDYNTADYRGVCNTSEQLAHCQSVELITNITLIKAGESTSFPQGLLDKTVIKQDPAGGTKVSVGSSVDLVCSQTDSLD